MPDSLRTLDEAIAAHIAENFPGALTDSWVLITHSVGIQDDDHGIHNYRMVTADTQPWHVDAGLVQAGVRIVRDGWDFAGDEDDDD